MFVSVSEVTWFAEACLDHWYSHHNLAAQVFQAAAAAVVVVVVVVAA